MTQRILIAVLAISTSLLAQQQTVTHEVDLEPPAEAFSSEGNWIDGDGTLPPSGVHGAIDRQGFRVRANGWEGGWSYPTFSVWTESGLPAQYSWIGDGSSRVASQMNWHGAVPPSGSDDHLVWLEKPFQRLIDLTLLNGQAVIDPVGVKTWCQPFLSQDQDPNVIGSSSRMWQADPPLWLQSSNYVGQWHSQQWHQMLTDFTTGDPLRPTVFSGGLALKKALILQSLVENAGSAGPANAFFNSGDYTTMVETGQIGLVIQMIAVRNEQLPTPAEWPTDESVPDVGSLPRIGLTRPSRWALLWPENRSSEFVIGFEGATVYAGRPFYFHADFSTWPIQVRFMTTTGPTTVNAYAVGTLDDPSRHAVRVPSNAIAGDVFYKSGLDSAFAKVGTLDEVLPQ
ncbi:MAG: hypothetical protein KDC98_23245 [Planctomycetes bacterium]|nr:hypothetical protein [Planctomycetota bacterium]